MEVNYNHSYIERTRCKIKIIAEGLNKMKHLVLLDISFCAIADSQILCLAEGLKCGRQLEKFYCVGNDIGLLGVVYLASGLKHCSN